MAHPGAAKRVGPWKAAAAAAGIATRQRNAAAPCLAGETRAAARLYRLW